MTVVVPNDLLKNTNIKEDIFHVIYSTKRKNENLDIRTTLHCMIFIQNGLKITHLDDTTTIQHLKNGYKIINL